MERLIAWAVFAAALAFALAPLAVPFGGFDPRAFPNPLPDPVAQPEGWTFSIWGLIYLWLVVTTLGAAIFHVDTPTFWPHRPWLLVALVVGAAWLFVAVESALWATLLIWIMWIGAVGALFRAPASHRWMVRGPVGLFAGWLTAAASISIALVGAGWGVGFGEVTWAVIALVLALVLGIWLMARLAVPEVALAIGWALVGLTVDASDKSTLVAGLAAAGAILMLVLAVRAVIRPSPRLAAV